MKFMLMAFALAFGFAAHAGGRNFGNNINLNSFNNFNNTGLIITRNPSFNNSPNVFNYQNPNRGQYVGDWTSNRNDPNSIHNSNGIFGNPNSPSSLNDPNGAGYPYINKNIKIYDSNGIFRGDLNNDPYDPNSVSNPYGRYGSKYSPDSINDPYGAGSPYNINNPQNPNGTGLKVYEDNN